MNGSIEDGVDLFWLVAVLVMAIGALVARRASFGIVARSTIGWIIIIGIVWTAVANRARIEGLVQSAAERLGGGQQSIAGDTVRIDMSSDGHFWARATINGFSRRMLIDSGATITALTPETARNAGIDLSGGGFPVIINTANGRVTAQRASIAQLSLSGILHAKDLDIVVSPAFGATDVLGMNFLSRLGSWSVEGRTLILKPRHAAKR